MGSKRIIRRILPGTLRKKWANERGKFLGQDFRSRRSGLKEG
jgi:hypothetical protein